jgi:hypothetical protein
MIVFTKARIVDVEPAFFEASQEVERFANPIRSRDARQGFGGNGVATE